MKPILRCFSKMRSLYIAVAVLLVNTLCTDGQSLDGDPARLPGVNLRGSDGDTCPTSQDTIYAIDGLRQNISAILDRCGGTGWRRVGYLDITDPSQSCPSGLALKSYSPGPTTCGRATDLLVYILQHWWFPIQQGMWDGQGVPVRRNQCILQLHCRGIDGYYVEGVSLTPVKVGVVRIYGHLQLVYLKFMLLALARFTSVVVWHPMLPNLQHS